MGSGTQSSLFKHCKSQCFLYQIVVFVKIKNKILDFKKAQNDKTINRDTSSRI
jgi:hypothetical protein